MSSPEVWEVGKNLPPGLWLPLADEPTDQYLAENFAHKDRPYSDILDYAGFLVALAFHEADNTGRINLMPNVKDFSEMRAAGYGMTVDTLNYKHGGLTRVQRDLGFYPRQYMPPDTAAPQVLNRFRWIANYAHNLDPLPEQPEKLRPLLIWGCLRSLSPSIPKVYKLFRGNLTPLRKICQLERNDYHHQYTKSFLYRFGARIFEEHGGPISSDELNDKYEDEFVTNPVAAIKFMFNSLTRFWMEFDHLPSTARGLSAQDAVNLGVRRAIAEGGVDIKRQTVTELSLRRKLVSRDWIQVNIDGGMPAYRSLVEADYRHYLSLRARFTEEGVSEDAFKAACRKFDTSDEFAGQLRNNIRVLRKLSRKGESASYILRIVQHGFNLLDDQIMELQLEDFKSSLEKIGIKSAHEVRAILDMVPRLDADEAITGLRLAA